MPISATTNTPETLGTISAGEAEIPTASTFPGARVTVLAKVPDHASPVIVLNLHAGNPSEITTSPGGRPCELRFCPGEIDRRRLTRKIDALRRRITDNPDRQFEKPRLVEPVLTHRPAWPRR